MTCKTFGETHEPTPGKLLEELRKELFEKFLEELQEMNSSRTYTVETPRGTSAGNSERSPEASRKLQKNYRIVILEKLLAGGSLKRTHRETFGGRF